MTTAKSQTVQQVDDNVSGQEALSVVQPENENSKNILELTHDEAHQYFLKQESYCSFDLPEYFKFETLLNSVDDALKGKNLSDFQKDNPRNYEDVNYKVLNNKDGKYAWRPLQLINPALYVSLVHKVTSEKNWELIKERFVLFSENKKIECVSIPRQSLTENSDKAEQMSNWWQHIEQRSIEMALDYSCLAHTDLTDCYGAIYTHSVAWAVTTKTDTDTRLKSLKRIDELENEMAELRASLKKETQFNTKLKLNVAVKECQDAITQLEQKL